MLLRRQPTSRPAREIYGFVKNNFALSRRTFLSASILSLGATLRAKEQSRTQTLQLNIVCVGAHPDDPESGCGGTLARYAEAGHSVTIIYLTRGERGIKGKSNDEAARIRTTESERACRILGAKPVFAGQIDGATEINEARTREMRQLITNAKPHILFTQWPIDTHPDHQVASLLTTRAYFAAAPKFALYFYEVNAGSQTRNFTPTDYVDITATREKKKAALFAHQSQDGEEIYRTHHEVMENFRGREAGVAAAEAFVRLTRDGARSGKLPGI